MRSTPPVTSRTYNHLRDGIFTDILRRGRTVRVEQRLDLVRCNPLRPFRRFGEGAFVLRPEDLVFKNVEVDQRAAVHVVPDGELFVERCVAFQGISKLARVS